MATTLTELHRAYPGDGIKRITYQITLDNSWLAAGEPLDFTADFTYINSAVIGDRDEAKGIYFYVKKPVYTTAITNANVLLMAYYSADGTDGEDLIAPVDTTDPIVTYMQVVVEGK